MSSASALQPLLVPPGQHPPFEVIDDDHAGGALIIVGACALVISLVGVLIRLYVRLVLSPPFGVDDYVLLSATAVAVVQSGVVFSNVSGGLGTSIYLLDPRSVLGIQRALTAGHVFWLVSVGLSKACTAGIHLRLTPRALHRNLLWATIGLTAAWVVISMFLLAVDCQVNGPWGVPSKSCSGLLPRWTFITALDIALEAILFSFSIPLVHGLQMPFRRKLIIVLSFASRLPVAIFAGIRLHRFHSFGASTNPTFDAIPFAIWTQLEMNASLVACVTFCLRPFMNAVRTNYGTAGDVVLGSSAQESASYTQAYGAGTKRYRESIALHPLKRKSHAGSTVRDPYVTPLDDEDEIGNGQNDFFRPVGEGLTLSSARRDGDSHDASSVGSDGSTRMIIRKQVEYQVQHTLRVSGSSERNRGVAV